MGLHQLQRVESYWKKRAAIWEQYMKAFAGLPLGLPAPFEAGTRHACHLFTILVDEERTGVSRDEFLNRMTCHGIGVGVHYISLPEHPYYQGTLGWKPEDYPNAMRIGRQTVSLPISSKLTTGDCDDVCAGVIASLGRGSSR